MGAENGILALIQNQKAGDKRARIKRRRANFIAHENGIIYELVRFLDQWHQWQVGLSAHIRLIRGKKGFGWARLRCN
jgi:hypothetical protein